MKKIISLIICSLVLSILWTIPAQADLTIGQKDTGFDPGLGPDDIVSTVTIQPDGKILIGGRFQSVDGETNIGIARLNADGTVDTLFAGQAQGDPFSVYAIATQPDFKILVGGAFTSYGGTPRNRIARIQIYGNLDTSFDPGDGADDVVEAIAIQPDGKILIAGGFTTYDGSDAPYIARLNPDGSLDNTFNPGTGPNESVDSLLLQPDGKIIIGGIFTQVGGVSKSQIARLNSDGSLDTGFNGSLPGRVRSIALAPDGKIIVGGNFAKGVRRLLSNGSNDTSFDPGSGANGYVRSVAVQPDGKVVLAGEFTAFNGIPKDHIVRLTSSGSVDNTFVSTGTDDYIFSLALQIDGKAILGGNFTTANKVSRNKIARLHPDGTLDNGLDPLGSNGTIHKVLSGPDSKIYIGGDFNYYYGYNNFARLHANGSLDPSYGDADPTKGANDIVYAMALQTDGKLLIGGKFTMVDNVSRPHIARLLANGKLDTVFTSSADGDVYDLALQPDGKVLIAGGFTHADCEARNRIARLNANGTLDTSFDPGTGANGAIYALALQPDDKILIAGEFTAYNGTARAYIARLNANGTLDTSFTPASPDAALRSVALQPDGKVLIGGYMEYVGSALRRGIARLNSNGTLDTTFYPGEGVQSYDKVVHDILVQEDGMILIGGNFLSYDGEFRRGIARLKAEGAVDTGFVPGSGVGFLGDEMLPGTVHSIALQPLGKVLIAGSFEIFFGEEANNIARLNGGSSPGTVEGSVTLNGKVGVPFSFEFTPTGFPLPWFQLSQSILPPGLSLSASGLISGIPTTPGTYHFNIAACNFVACTETAPLISIEQADDPGDPVKADFAASPTSGDAPLKVNFTNQSTGDYDTCQWVFGDGHSSDNCNNPSHTYQADGAYTVALTVSGGGGTDTHTRVNYIIVGDPWFTSFLPLILR